MKCHEDVLAIVEGLKELYPDGLCSLQYPEPHELLFSVRLAAQCTDERVNMVTPALFARFPTLEALAGADVSEVEELIHSTGFFRAKARDIVAASRMMLEEFGGRVPDDMQDLLRLPGVGRKTANLILGDVYRVPGVVVADTHCIRISGRLGSPTGRRTLPRWSSSCARSCLRRSPTISATGWCSMAGQCVWPGSRTALNALCGPGAIHIRRMSQNKEIWREKSHSLLRRRRRRDFAFTRMAAEHVWPGRAAAYGHCYGPAGDDCRQRLWTV